jgi:hypothetical protein
MRVKFEVRADFTESKPVIYWCDLQIIPRQYDRVNVIDFLDNHDWRKVKDDSDCWSGTSGAVEVVILRKDDTGFYYEISVYCEDHK